MIVSAKLKKNICRIQKMFAKTKIILNINPSHTSFTKCSLTYNSHNNNNWYHIISECFLSFYQ